MTRSRTLVDFYEDLYNSGVAVVKIVSAYSEQLRHYHNGGSKGKYPDPLTQHVIADVSIILIANDVTLIT